MVNAPPVVPTEGRCVVTWRFATHASLRVMLRLLLANCPGSFLRLHAHFHDGQRIVRGLENAIKSKRVTFDLARQMPGATEVSTSPVGDETSRG